MASTLGGLNTKATDAVAGRFASTVTPQFDSRDDAYKAYLGEPKLALMPSPHDNISNTNYDLPEAYVGQNLHLKTTLEGLIMNQSNEFYTTILLPWSYTDQIKFNWNTWQFDDIHVPEVPHEGISRYIRSEERRVGKECRL